MNIGICHFRMGGLDGVSLEIAKWKDVLEKMGHRVHLCAGGLGEEEGFLISELNPEHPDVQKILRNSFIKLADCDELGLRREINRMAAVIKRGLRTFIEQFSIELLVVENIWSLGVNPPAAIAFWNVIKDLQVPTIAHHHDFHWEKTLYRPTCTVVEEILERYFPPQSSQIRHVVLNSLVQTRLRKEGIEAEVIPNVFDFAGPSWEIDEFNHDFRAAIGVRAKDILVLQATRIVRRKGIELAVDLVRELSEHLGSLKGQSLYNGRRIGEDSRAVLVLANWVENGYLESRYYEQLEREIARKGIEARFVEDLIGPKRSEKGKKRYSFWDAYVFADLITYPSLQEGWGNQFLEAIFAKKPMVIFEYEVFRADIKPHGFQIIALGSEFTRDEEGLAHIPLEILHAAADEVLQVLVDPKLRREMVEHNFQLGRRYYSLEILKLHLGRILSDLERAIKRR